MMTTARIVQLLLLLLMVMTANTHACTLVHLEPVSEPGTLVIGRTLEYGATKFDGVEAAVLLEISPRGRAPALLGRNNTYGYVAIGSGKGGVIIAAVDGINEHGLTVSAHTLHQSQYERASVDDTKIHFSQVVPWILGTFRDVADLEHGIHSVRIVGSSREESLFVHWAVQDASGRSVVIEVIQGELQLHQNTVGVFTNDPDFTWHLRNLNQYAGITNRDHDFDPDICVDTKEAGFVPVLHSHGLNLNSLPGGMSPAARFVRMFFMKALAVKSAPPHTVRDGLVLMSRLIDSVQIPRGVLGKIRDHDDFEFTQWSILKIPKQKLLYYRSYRDANWRKFDLRHVKFGPLARARTIVLSSPSRGSGTGWGDDDDDASTGSEILLNDDAGDHNLATGMNDILAHDEAQDESDDTMLTGHKASSSALLLRGHDDRVVA